MAILSTGNSFGDTDTVTSTKLNNIANQATFDEPVDDSTLELITAGADIGKLGIKNGGVTFAKLTDVIDDDTMATATDTTLATSESIKAYVDGSNPNPSRGYESLTNSTVSGNVQQNTTGRPLWTSFTLFAGAGGDVNYLFLSISPNSDMSGGTRLGQSRITGSPNGGWAAAQVTGIVPSNYYWRYEYDTYDATPTEMVHSSFIL